MVGRVLVALFAAAITAAPIRGAAQPPKAEQSPPEATAKPAPPRIPDTFTNLQVLPKDISKPELMRIMKGFAMTMEKRCSFCHVATDDLSQADFASDDKQTKKKTRELMQFILETKNKPAKAP